MNFKCDNTFRIFHIQIKLQVINHVVPHTNLFPLLRLSAIRRGTPPNVCNAVAFSSLFATSSLIAAHADSIINDRWVAGGNWVGDVIKWWGPVGAAVGLRGSVAVSNRIDARSVSGRSWMKSCNACLPVINNSCVVNFLKFPFLTV